MRRLRVDCSMRCARRLLVRGPGILLLLAMPVGIETDSSSTTGLDVGLHGGTGHVASVLRNCDGQALHSEKSKFTDASGSISAIIPYTNKSSVVVGIRTGRWSSHVGFAQRTGTGSYSRTKDTLIDFTYLNPHISVEGEKYGFGVGFFRRGVPSGLRGQFSGLIQASGHLRLGSLRKGYLLVSMAENQPLISGGGLLEIAVGYPVGTRSYMQSGLAGGFYDGMGFVQQGRVRLARPLSLDFSLRLGAHGQSAVSGGVVLHLGGS
jgi:hypothetical protein